MDNTTYIHTYTAAAAAAKSLQSCPTLCDPIDSSPPSPSVPGILQERTLEWVPTAFSHTNTDTYVHTYSSCHSDLLQPSLFLFFNLNTFAKFWNGESCLHNYVFKSGGIFTEWPGAVWEPPFLGWSPAQPLPSLCSVSVSMKSGSWQGCAQECCDDPVSKDTQVPPSAGMEPAGWGLWPLLRPPSPFPAFHSAPHATVPGLIFFLFAFSVSLLYNTPITTDVSCCSVAKLCLTLGPHGLQHARLPCPSLSSRVSSNSCSLSWWCQPISSSVAPFSSCPQSFPESGSFPLCQLFASGGQTIGDSVSASALSMNIQGWFPLRLTGLVSFNACFSAVLSFACLLGYLTSMNYVNNLRFILMFFPVLKIYNELSIHDLKGVYHGFPNTWDCIIYAFLYLSHSVTW